MPNQRDVALHAGVSSASVSRYLSNPSLVKPENAVRISQAIEQLNYKLDYHAQRLKMGRSNHIAILTPGSGPFYWQLIFHMQKVLTSQGYFLSIMHTRDIDPSLPSNREHIFSALRNKLLEGIIFFPMLNRMDEEIFEILDRQHENVIVVDAQLGSKRFCQVMIDNRSAGRQAAREFLARGHREFLLVHGIHDFYSAGERRAGFLEELQKEGLGVDENRVIVADFNPQTAYELALKRMDSLPPFSAVFAENDAMAIGFMRAAFEKGRQCPRDYSIIGFDNNVEFVPFCTPSLTSFEQHLHLVGEATGKLLLSMLDGEITQAITKTFTPNLVIRESLARAPR